MTMPLVTVTQLGVMFVSPALPFILRVPTFRLSIPPALRGESVISPVELPPMMSEPLTNDCIVPFDESEMPVPLVIAAIDAVGVPEFIFSTANFAEDEAVLPRSRSTVVILGLSAPLALSQKLLEGSVPGSIHEIVPDPFVCSMYWFVPSADGQVYATPFNVVVPVKRTFPTT